MRRRSLTAVLFSFFAIFFFLTACGNADSSANRPKDMPGMGMDQSGAGGPMGHDHAESSPVVEGARKVSVEATSFAFDPPKITIAAGEDIALVLTSDDLLHDFTIDGLDVHVAADRGETAEGGLRADKTGEYTYYCSVPGHRAAGMEGTLIVEES